MDPNPQQVGVERNKTFFLNEQASYAANVAQLDTYARMRASINESVTGIGELLDIGNGGVFDYDTKLLGHITAVDLFLDDLPKDFACPVNVTMQAGSALELPYPENHFDGVLIVMLLHHLTGSTVPACKRNVAQALAEAYRVLKPGGKLIIVESCVPRWFYLFETVAFTLLVPFFNRISKHPLTLQFPVSNIARQLREIFGNLEEKQIPKGKWILQFGKKVPACLTPVQTFRLIATKGSPA